MQVCPILEPDDGEKERYRFAVLHCKYKLYKKSSLWTRVGRGIKRDTYLSSLIS